MLQSHAEHFRSKEATCAGGSTRREGVFNAAQERQAHAFHMPLSHIETQAEFADSLEEDITKRMKSMTESFSKRQILQLEAAREGHSARFKESQRRRDAEFGVLTLALRPPVIPGRQYAGVTHPRLFSTPPHGRTLRRICSS